MKLKDKIIKLCKFLIVFGLFFTFAEYGIYYKVINQCSWPKGPVDKGNESLKAIYIADPHLLGPYHGHWFDKLRREWFMKQSYKVAVEMLKPEVIFILGDLFDEGHIVDSNYFNHTYIPKFRRIFYSPMETKIFIISGNHDIGFHNDTSENLVKRFESAFKSPAVQRVLIKNINFILINSMGMEGDNCSLCHRARKNIYRISDELNCEKQASSPKCRRLIIDKTKPRENKYSRPIVLQHFPMYRESERRCQCVEPNCNDMVPEPQVPNRNKIDCLSREATEDLLRSLNPRMIVSGHTHYSCLVYHNKGNPTGQFYDDWNSIPEYSIPSFNPRNLKNPSFFLALISPYTHQMTKCMLPRESEIITIYLLGTIMSLLLAFVESILDFVNRCTQQICSRKVILRFIRRNRKIDKENAYKLL